MGPRSRIVVGLFALVVFAGCASTKVSNRETAVREGEQLPRPNHILVYDFVATPAEAAR